MALISCTECGKEISDSAKTCIYCGMPLKKQKDIAKEGSKKTESFFKKHKKKIIATVSIFFVIALIAGIAFISWVFSPAQVAKREAEDARAAYERLQRANESLLQEEQYFNSFYYDSDSGFYRYY